MKLVGRQSPRAIRPQAAIVNPLRPSTLAAAHTNNESPQTSAHSAKNMVIYASQFRTRHRRRTATKAIAAVESDSSSPSSQACRSQAARLLADQTDQSPSERYAEGRLVFLLNHGRPFRLRDTTQSTCYRALSSKACCHASRQMELDHFDTQRWVRTRQFDTAAQAFIGANACRIGWKYRHTLPVSHRLDA